MPWMIYTLCDPRFPSDVRYVGKTSCSLKKRVSGHLSYASRSPSRTHLVSWLNSLTSEGLEPKASVVEVGDEGDWEEAEKRWISHYRIQGYNLCNSTDGGEGASPGHVKSPETRRKLSIAQTGKKASPEARAKMSAARKGRGPVLTPESYRKMALTKTGKRGPKQSPERVAQRTAKVKKTWERKLASGWKPPVPCSPEGRARTIAANTGRCRSDETKAKISAANSGKTVTQEALIKRKATLQRKAWERDLHFLSQIFGGRG